MTRAKADPTKRKKRERVVSTPPTDPGVTVYVELWLEEDAGAIPTASSAIPLVNDLLLAEGASICESSGSSLRAKLPDSGRAVLAAGHLHLAMEGFSQTRKEGRVNYLCLLTTEETQGAGLEAQGSNSIAGEVDSGTVLIAGDLCDAMRLLPGVVLRPLDRAPRSAVLANQQIAEMVRPAEFTEMLRELSVREVPAVEAPANSETRNAESFAQASKHVSPGQKGSWLIVGTVAACLLAGAVTIGVLGRRSSTTVAAPTADIAPSPDANTAPVPPAATPPAPRPLSPVTPAKENLSSRGSSLPERHKMDPPRELPTKPEKPKEEAHARTGSTGGVVTFDRSEIPRMNAMAERAAGDGNYDRAIAIFESVLRNDPNNSDARRGLEKARHNRGKASPQE